MISKSNILKNTVNNIKTQGFENSLRIGIKSKIWKSAAKSCQNSTSPKMLLNDSKRPLFIKACKIDPGCVIY